MCERGGAAFRCAHHRGKDLTKAETALGNAQRTYGSPSLEVQAASAEVRSKTVSLAATPSGRRDIESRLHKLDPNSSEARYLQRILDEGEHLAAEERAERARVRELAEWEEAGSTTETRRSRLIKSIVDSRNKQEWEKFADTNPDSEDWRRVVDTADEAREWKAAGFEANSIWIGVDNMTPAQAAEWDRYGFTPQTAAAEILNQVEPDEAYENYQNNNTILPAEAGAPADPQWTTLGFDTAQAIAWSESGFTPQEAHDHRIRGHKFPVEAARAQARNLAMTRRFGADPYLSEKDPH